MWGDAAACAKHPLQMELAQISEPRQILQGDCLVEACLDMLDEPPPQDGRQTAPQNRTPLTAITRVGKELPDGRDDRLFGQEPVAALRGSGQMHQSLCQSWRLVEGRLRQKHQPGIAVEGLGKEPAQLAISDVKMHEFEVVGDLPFG